nr:TATA box-binding protein-associated factor RNA polymerase I subunit B [Tanacetum cinerariifolium]
MTICLLMRLKFLGLPAFHVIQKMRMIWIMVILIFMNHEYAMMRMIKFTLKHFVNKKLVRLMDVIGDQWLDLMYGGHKKVKFKVKEEVVSKWETEGVRPAAKHKAKPHNLVNDLEPILSTDIIKWTLKGKLPYFAAFVEIDEQIGPPINACPLSSSRMFRPIHAITVQNMESLAASLANSIRLELPLVNFYAIVSRYLRRLSLLVETISPSCLPYI